MTTEPYLRCRNCRRPVPPDAPLGCCPACIADMALRLAPNGDTLAGGDRVASCEELASFFPGLKIVKLLGRGGMGAVYQAVQPKLDREVALKILHPELATDPEFAERFFREARVLAKLNHPNVVAVHDVGQSGPYLYLLMEYVEGATLRDLMQSGRIEPAEALRMVPQICEAIQYAHDRGVVHRDIKPENILLNEEGAVKIADFGLAKLAGPLKDNLTSTSARMGTVHYMAPEQAQNTSAVDHRADIYSLGVTFYEMLTGHLPTVDYQPPSKKTDVSSEVDRIVGRSLKSVPDERYQRAAEMKDDVERVAFRRGRKSGMAWGITLSAAVLVTAVTSMVMWGSNPQTNKAVANDETTQAASPIETAAAVVHASVDAPELMAPTVNGTPARDEQPPAPIPVATPTAPPIPNIAELFNDKWTWTDPVNLGPNVNSPANDTQPCLSSDGLTLIFSSDRSLSGQWTQDLWQCRRTDVNAPWGPAELLPPPVNTSAFESDPCLSGDGLHLAFVSNRFGGAGDVDVWICHRETVEAPWSRIENPGPTVNTPGNDSLGGFFVDDKELLFSSRHHADVQHGLWIARRKNTHAPYGPPVPLQVDTGRPEHLGNPFLTADGRVIIWTGRNNSEQAPVGSHDLCYSTRAVHNTPYQTRARVDGTVNSIYGDSGPFLSWDGMTLVFESDRPGSMGWGDIWMARRIPIEAERASDPDPNYALALDGESTIVEIPSLYLENQGPHTLELWVRAKAPAAQAEVMAVGGLSGCQLNLGPEGYIGGNRTLNRTKTAGASAGDGADWAHVAYVFDDQTGALFLNGKEVSRVPKDGVSDSAEVNAEKVTWIGGYPGADGMSPQFLLRGEIDEVRVSSSVRYTVPFTPERKFVADADTVALYHFDEGHGDRVTDASGHEHHGTIRMPYWVRVK